MRLIDLRCSGCGATMQVNPELKQVSCNYCGRVMLIDDEIKKMELINGFNYGRDVEMGRIVVQKEQELVQLSSKKTTKIVMMILYGVILTFLIIFCSASESMASKIFLGLLCILPVSGLFAEFIRFLSIQSQIDYAKKIIKENKR